MRLEEELRESIRQAQIETYSSLRMGIVHAVSWAGLDAAWPPIVQAMKAKRITWEQYQRLVSYGKVRRTEIQPPKSDTNGDIDH